MDAIFLAMLAAWELFWATGYQAPPPAAPEAPLPAATRSVCEQVYRGEEAPGL